MRQLIGARLLERGAVGHAGYIGVGRGPIAGNADFRDAQDIRHQQIRGGEAISHQPFPLAENDIIVPRHACTSKQVGDTRDCLT